METNEKWLQIFCPPVTHGKIYLKPQSEDSKYFVTPVMLIGLNGDVKVIIHLNNSRLFSHSVTSSVC